MRRGARIALLAVAAIGASPFIAFGAYDIASFQSRRAEIERLLASATSDERNPSESLKRLVRISLSDHTAAFAARVLIRELPVPTNGMLGWHVTNTLWWGLATLHLSEQDHVALLVSRSYMGNHRYGYSAESIARFRRPLAELNQEEEATLVALSHAPSIYLESPERLEARKKWLLRELKNGT